MAKTLSDPVTVMKRHELKYLLDEKKTAYFRRRLEEHMLPDGFGLTTIGSVYYDTPERRLIRASLERPEFKEKLRLRSYGPATESSRVFLELKCKAGDVVYKRRVQTSPGEADAFLGGERALGGGQIGRELAAFRDYYAPLSPACLILYDRTAYYEPEGDLRLTIDAAPRYRTEDPSLGDFSGGVPLLPEGWTILELKIQDAVPLWLARILSEGKIYKSSFSKYGEAYRREMQKIAV
ncbi:MAG: polyphosphate polymerase domain-containing protein [Oscillospiraceae bacterium]|nr:polyphosphate polymerase domain-containing protein [Oscillospiraceae bacterium]